MTDGAVVFSGPTQVSVFAMLTLKSAIGLYAKCGIRVNRMYTPTNMKRTVEYWTGRGFKRGDWPAMIRALEEKIEETRASESFAEGR